MPRAPKACAEVGCLEAAVKRGRCAAHQVQPWAGAYRVEPPGWARLRRQVLQGTRCAACGGVPGVVDHIVPLARGGTWERTNLQPLCQPCHHAKTMRDAQEGKQRRRKGPEG